MEIKLASLRYAEQILAVYAPYCSTPITFELSVPTKDEMWQRIESTLVRYPWLLAIDDNKVLGYAYGHAFRDRPAYRWTVETSVYVALDQHRKGIGTALYGRLLDLLRQQGFVTAMAGITLPNPPSVRLHEVFGFRRIALLSNIGYKNRAWHEVALYSRELNPAGFDPPEPLEMAAILERCLV